METNVMFGVNNSKQRMEYQMNFLKLSLVMATLISTTAHADTYVRGYTRSNGTYVQPHYRSDSNGTKMDNWSTRGNTNPYTGESGHKNPYDSGSSYGSGSSYNTGSSNNFGSSNSWDD